ncbi:16S ribosomal RNA methyltransferase A [Methanobrevibacter sp. OttesenSCG-928-K11]|nr:16S ribosomal RNA methyltransferase A [Methanobrevibacter sp. OttesenSCG-928-K11]MDL2270413.1 16S ribosomal RNA methyltransferase A [Methanobrevibacter sp. OttesenSCG-928-I08]
MQDSYSLAKETKEILKKHNAYLNKSLGQNYLIDNNKKEQIINFANLNKNDTVLEVGSGIGTLTLDLSFKSRKVIAIEKDSKISKILSERLENAGIDNVELINDDALDIDFPYFNKIVSNLPYQISSPITFKFLDYTFDLAILMYQKEFANRMSSKISTKNYSRLSTMLYFKCDIEYLTNVSKESFLPKPKIDSTVIKLTPKISNDLTKEEYDIYGTFTKALFQHKNKKSRNAIIDSRHVFGYSDKKEIKNTLNEIDSFDVNELLSKKVVNSSPQEILFLSQQLKYIIK